MCCWYFEESSSAFKNIEYQKHYELILLFHASAHDRNTKWNFFALLLTTETPNETFSCFCTRQKHQMKLFRASAHDRKAKKNFFMLLHASERPKRSFSRFCILQKGQKEDFRCRRKSFPEWFGISAPGESYFRDNLLKIVTINIHKWKRWSS